MAVNKINRKVNLKSKTNRSVLKSKKTKKVSKTMNGGSKCSPNILKGGKSVKRRVSKKKKKQSGVRTLKKGTKKMKPKRQNRTQKKGIKNKKYRSLKKKIQIGGDDPKLENDIIGTGFDNCDKFAKKIYHGIKSEAYANNLFKDNGIPKGSYFLRKNDKKIYISIKGITENHHFEVVEETITQKVTYGQNIKIKTLKHTHNGKLTQNLITYIVPNIYANRNQLIEKKVFPDIIINLPKKNRIKYNEEKFKHISNSEEKVPVYTHEYFKNKPTLLWNMPIGTYLFKRDENGKLILNFSMKNPKSKRGATKVDSLFINEESNKFRLYVGGNNDNKIFNTLLDLENYYRNNEIIINNVNYGKLVKRYTMPSKAVERRRGDPPTGVPSSPAYAASGLGYTPEAVYGKSGLVLPTIPREKVEKILNNKTIGDFVLRGSQSKVPNAHSALSVNVSDTETPTQKKIIHLLIILNDNGKYQIQNFNKSFDSLDYLIKYYKDNNNIEKYLTTNLKNQYYKVTSEEKVPEHEESELQSTNKFFGSKDLQYENTDVDNTRATAILNKTEIGVGGYILREPSTKSKKIPNVYAALSVKVSDNKINHFLILKNEDDEFYLQGKDGKIFPNFHQLIVYCHENTIFENIKLVQQYNEHGAAIYVKSESIYAVPNKDKGKSVSGQMPMTSAAMHT